MLKAEERMELDVVRRHGASHRLRPDRRPQGLEGPVHVISRARVSRRRSSRPTLDEISEASRPLLPAGGFGCGWHPLSGTFREAPHYSRCCKPLRSSVLEVTAALSLRDTV